MTLKPIETELEIKFLFETRSNDIVDRWLLNKKPENFHSHLEYLMSNNHKNFEIYIAYEGEVMVGYCQIKKRIEGEDEVELGLALSPNYLSKGMGISMLNEIVKKIDMDKNPISFILDANIPSIKTHERCGFLKVGCVDSDKGNILKYKLFRK